MAELIYSATISKKAASASIWNITQVFAGGALRLSSNLIMTRLIAPDAFGMMALIVSVTIAFELFSDIGIQKSIIKDSDGDTTSYLRAAWTLKIIRGFFLSFTIMILAISTWIIAPKWGPMNTIYSDPLLPFLIGAMSVVPILEGAKSTSAMLAVRIFHNGRVTLLQILGQFSGAISQICIAMIWPSIWALVIGLITGNAIRLALSHVIFDGPRMAWEPDPDISYRIWSFGKHLMASSTLIFFATNADKFVLSLFLDVKQFGVYSISSIWISSGLSVMNKISNNVAFSVFSDALRITPKSAPKIFKKTQSLFDGTATVLFLLFFVTGEGVLRLLYTESYYASGRMVTFLSLVFLSSRFATMDMFILNHGNSRAMMITSGIRAIAILIFLPLGYTLIGIEGALLAVALTPLSSAPYTIWLIRPLLGEGYAARQVLWVVAILLTAVAVYLTY